MSKYFRIVKLDYCDAKNDEYHVKTKYGVKSIFKQSIRENIGIDLIEWVKEKLGEYSKEIKYVGIDYDGKYVYFHTLKGDKNISKDISNYLNDLFVKELEQYRIPSLTLLIHRKLKNEKYMFESIQSYVNKKYKVQDNDFTLIREILDKYKF